jgi:hypothetical protein
LADPHESHFGSSTSLSVASCNQARDQAMDSLPPPPPSAIVDIDKTDKADIRGRINIIRTSFADARKLAESLRAPSTDPSANAKDEPLVVAFDQALPFQNFNQFTNFNQFSNFNNFHNFNQFSNFNNFNNK